MKRQLQLWSQCAAFEQYYEERAKAKTNIDVSFSGFFFFLSRPPSNNRVISSFLATRQRCKATTAAAQGKIAGKPFVRAFYFSFHSPTNHKNTPSSLTRQKRAAAGERTDSTPSMGRRKPPTGTRMPTTPPNVEEDAPLPHYIESNLLSSTYPFERAIYGRRRYVKRAIFILLSPSHENTLPFFVHAVERQRIGGR